MIDLYDLMADPSGLEVLLDYCLEHNLPVVSELALPTEIAWWWSNSASGSFYPYYFQSSSARGLAATSGTYPCSTNVYRRSLSGHRNIFSSVTMFPWELEDKSHTHG